MSRRVTDPAIIGSCRIGYFRIGVCDLTGGFDEKLHQLQDQPAKSSETVDPFVTGSWHSGRVRSGVIDPIFDRLIHGLGHKKKEAEEEAEEEEEEGVFPYTFPYELS